MGILDALNSTDPSQQAQLALAAHLLGARSVKGERGGFGQALGGGLLAYQQAMEQGRGNEMKRKQQQLQIDAAEREAKANLPPSAEDMAKFTGLMTGTPERMDIAGNPNAYMPPTPAQPANPMGAYGFAMGSQNPNLQKIGVQGMHQFPQLEATRMERQESRDWRTHESEIARKARAEELQAKLADARTSQAERLAAQKEMREMQIQAQKELKQFGASLAAGMRQEPAPSLTTIIDPADPTKMITVNARTYDPKTRAGVIGTSGKEPGAMKKEDQASNGREQVSGIVTNLRDMYTQLGTGGGIVDSEKGALSNIPARLSATGMGQFGGQLVGTKNQKLRDSVEQQRPLLLNAIKNATGMSAKQMDSNAEMKLYLAAATDPTKDIQANMEALDNLEKLFGQSAKGALPNNPKPKAKTVLRTGTLNGRKVNQYSDGTTDYAD